MTPVIRAESPAGAVEARGVVDRAASEAELAQFVATHAAAVIGAEFSSLALLVDRGRTVRWYHGTSLNPSIADRYSEFELDAPYPFAAAIRSGRTVVVASRDECRERYRAILPETIAAEIEATVSVPLIRRDHSTIGALGFAWTTAPEFAPRLNRAVDALAVLCADLIERAETLHAEHQFVADLHRKLLEELPAHPGIVTATRYLPAGVSASVGGDWYAGLAIGGGKFAVVVGDVAGHGLSAAADMALVRGTISSRLYEGVRPNEVFGRVSRILHARAHLLLATAAVVIVDPHEQSLTYVTAGHPPPILIGADGAVRLLDDANAPMLGIAATFDVAQQVPFPPSSKVVMFTDGLVERRDRPADVGIAQACQLVGKLDPSAPPEALVEALLAGLVGARVNQDDIAIVVIESVAIPG